MPACVCRTVYIKLQLINTKELGDKSMALWALAGQRRGKVCKKEHPSVLTWLTPVSAHIPCSSMLGRLKAKCAAQQREQRGSMSVNEGNSSASGAEEKDQE
eukprot:1151191-Pelagomonas_calceolata.AAC.4